MTESEAEKRIVAIMREYCFSTHNVYQVLYHFLFKFGGLYKINTILNQIDDQDEGC